VLIAGNWKMFKGPAETEAFLAAFDPPAGVEVVLCPPFVSLGAAVGSGCTVYAQNVHWEPAGAFTGEVSPTMLRELGVDGALVGHSERRQHFGETDETVARRTRAALEEGLGVIACVGETLEQREQDQAADIVVGQLRGSLEGVDGDAAAEMVIAYEPVWAIGTGRTATPDDAQQMCSLVRSTLGDRYGDRVAEAVRVQYGGSVKPGNAAALLRQPDVDGALVGGASLEPDDFAVICRFQRL